MKRVIVLNPFKVGSSSLNLVLNQHKIEGIKLHGYGPDLKNKYPPNTVDGVILIYRKSLDRYVSAFFEDCAQSVYPYYYGTRDKVLNASVDDLIAHFERFDWTRYAWLNYDFFVKLYQDTFRVGAHSVYDFFKSDDQTQSATLIGYNGHKEIPCLLLKTQYLDQSCPIINQTFGINLKTMAHGRQGSDKWYKQQYHLFKTKLQERMTNNPTFYQKLMQNL